MTKPSDSTLNRLFAGTAEHVFLAQLGVADPPLIDYLTDLLLRFVRIEALHKVRNLRGKPLGHVVDMLAEAEARMGEARREVHRHIGDFTLFWTGIYPESLRRSGRHARDQFGDFCVHGKRAYRIASSIDSDGGAPAEILERLSEQFEMCAYGLREVRREWERHDGDADGGQLLLN